MWTAKSKPPYYSIYSNVQYNRAVCKYSDQHYIARNGTQQPGVIFKCRRRNTTLLLLLVVINRCLSVLGGSLVHISMTQWKHLRVSIYGMFLTHQAETRVRCCLGPLHWCTPSSIWWFIQLLDQKTPTDDHADGFSTTWVFQQYGALYINQSITCMPCVNLHALMAWGLQVSCIQRLQVQHILVSRINCRTVNIEKDV